MKKIKILSLLLGLTTNLTAMENQLNENLLDSFPGVVCRNLYTYLDAKDFASLHLVNKAQNERLKEEANHFYEIWTKNLSKDNDKAINALLKAVCMGHQNAKQEMISQGNLFLENSSRENDPLPLRVKNYAMAARYGNITAVNTLLSTAMRQDNSGEFRLSVLKSFNINWKLFKPIDRSEFIEQLTTLANSEQEAISQLAIFHLAPVFKDLDEKKQLTILEKIEKLTKSKNEDIRESFIRIFDNIFSYRHLLKDSSSNDLQHKTLNIFESILSSKETDLFEKSIGYFCNHILPQYINLKDYEQFDSFVILKILINSDNKNLLYDILCVFNEDILKNYSKLDNWSQTQTLSRLKDFLRTPFTDIVEMQKAKEYFCEYVIKDLSTNTEYNENKSNELSDILFYFIDKKDTVVCSYLEATGLFRLIQPFYQRENSENNKHAQFDFLDLKNDDKLKVLTLLKIISHSNNISQYTINGFNKHILSSYPKLDLDDKEKVLNLLNFRLTNEETFDFLNKYIMSEYSNLKETEKSKLLDLIKVISKRKRNIENLESIINCLNENIVPNDLKWGTISSILINSNLDKKYFEYLIKYVLPGYPYVEEQDQLKILNSIKEILKTNNNMDVSQKVLYGFNEHILSQYQKLKQYQKVKIVDFLAEIFKYNTKEITQNTVIMDTFKKCVVKEQEDLYKINDKIDNLYNTIKSFERSIPVDNLYNMSKLSELSTTDLQTIKFEYIFKSLNSENCEDNEILIGEVEDFIIDTLPHYIELSNDDKIKALDILNEIFEHKDKEIAKNEKALEYFYKYVFEEYKNSSEVIKRKIDEILNIIYKD